MKILYYNIFEGCQEKTRFLELVSFINKVDPDIACLVELNTWDKEKKEQMISLTKFKEGSICKANTRFNLGIFYKQEPIRITHHHKGFHHGVIQAEFHLMNLLITHFSPNTEEDRIQEVMSITPLITNNTLLVGDLNSLSPLDKHPPQLLNKLLEVGIKKFGEKKLRTEAQTKLLQLGLNDLGHEITNNTQNTVPTKFNTDKNHQIPLRLDYALASKQICSRASSFKIIKNKQTEHISDHFPFILEINNGKQ